MIANNEKQTEITKN